MEKQNYSWTTEFKTAEDLMIHTFSDRVKVVSNIKTGLVKVFRDDVVISTDENPSIAQYEAFLSKIAIDAEKLERFSTEE